MRILHGPVNVGNQPWVLSRAERQLGASSDVVVRNDTWLGYSADRVLSAKSAGFVETAIRSTAFGLKNQWRYDVLHFYFGQTFLSPGFPLSAPGSLLSRASLLTDTINRLSAVDLHVARFFNKKLFMTLQGCDVRLANEGNKRNQWTMCAPQHCELYQRCTDALDHRRNFLIEKVLPLFDRVFYLNPELGHVVPNGRFLPYSNVEIEKFDVALPSQQGRPKIVHAPTAGRIKGTPMIMNALEQLRSRYDFDLVLVENTSHERALEIYRSADLAIDQVLAGWYGGFAVEMMAMGKPVACYIREEDMMFVPDAIKRDLPLYRLNPANLVEDIAAILDRRSEWQIRGQASRLYVERWHNPKQIAKAMLDAYEDPNSDFKLIADAS
ncbi:glycosyltransferase family 4 protein [Bradyrhizobium uaiense]|uniref:Glycosyltransferase family 4 protein n=1 Tax=Bradyrhizobium uaiense TaxID=2594946 RepID=A0A6P1BEY0_9BRAD|nr:glycosyltransferase family 4 protein [Bradyrhizobium uaiense]NEU96190.1 glycosyltransferase family 4 protein [Bradyrhizobium uaiense]